MFTGELPRLRTDRLELRPFEADDAVSVERLAGAWEVADTTLNIPHPYPVGSARDWIATHAEHWTRGSGMTLAICDAQAARAHIGTISLMIDPVHAHAELGYWIALSAWGKGFATEAAHAMARYAFSDLHMHRLQGRHFTRNPASGRVMQKIGMRIEGVHREACRRWNRFEDIAMYGMLASDWHADRL